MLSTDLRRTCRAAAIRLTLRRSLRYGMRATVIALAMGLGISLVSLVVPVDIPLWWILGGALAIGSLVLLLTCALQPTGIRAASQLLDRQFALHERVSTALELISSSANSGPLQVRAVADAIRHLAEIDLRRAFPIRPPREAIGVLLLTGLVVLAQVGLSGISLPGTPAREVARRIQEEGNRLAQIAQTLQTRARAERLPQTRRSSQDVHDLGVGLQRDRLDRAGALARIADLVQQTQRLRREVTSRLEQARPRQQAQTSIPPNAVRQDTLDRQIKQLRELNTRLKDDLSAADQQQVRQRLAAIMNQGLEGPDEVQQNLQQARDQLQRGNVPQAGRAVGEALRNLEALRALTGEEAGLEAVQQQLQQSAARIGSGATQPSARDGQQSSINQLPPSMSGPLAPSSEGTEPAPPPPQGPHPGVLPGRGEIADKLGVPSPRLQGDKTPSSLRGESGQGEMSSSEVIAAARPGLSRLPLRPVAPTAVSDADRYMERASIPAHYRHLVRRYFERLVQLR